VRQWVDEWIDGIEDVTEIALGMKELLDGDESVGVEELKERGLMPLERVYKVEEEIRERLEMDA
jgi:hypothetical protein